MQTQLEALSKACDIAEKAGMSLLKKSQMQLFGNEQPHHSAYTRTTASGTVSNIAQLNDANARSYKEVQSKISNQTAKLEDAKRDGDNKQTATEHRNLADLHTQAQGHPHLKRNGAEPSEAHSHYLEASQHNGYAKTLENPKRDDSKDKESYKDVLRHISTRRDELANARKRNDMHSEENAHGELARLHSQALNHKYLQDDGDVDKASRRDRHREGVQRNAEKAGMRTDKHGNILDDEY